MKWSDPASPNSKDGLADSWQLANKESIEQREKEEASRLLYVAMTRAEQHLILSYSAFKRTSSWVKLIEDRLGLALCNPLPQPQILTAATPGGRTFEIEARVMEAEPTDPAESDSAWQSEPAVEIVPRPAPGEQHDSAVNVTSLAVFAECPRKYYIERYIGWNGSRRGAFDPEELPGEAGTPAAQLGSEVHEILAGKPGPHSTEAEALAGVFRDSALGRRAAASSKPEREWEFIVEIGGTLVRGSIDLWFEEGGQIHIVDYKTDDVTSKEAATRAAQYQPQLALYAVALERALGRRPASASLHFLRPNVVVEIALNASAPAELVARLLEAQNALRFDLNEGEHCRSCAFYRSLCPAGQPVAAAPIT
jgi:ATP-dependent exoDNAse (exonuclease V) beta subunit